MRGVANIEPSILNAISLLVCCLHWHFPDVEAVNAERVNLFSTIGVNEGGSVDVHLFSFAQKNLIETLANDPNMG